MASSRHHPRVGERGAKFCPGAATGDTGIKTLLISLKVATKFHEVLIRHCHEALPDGSKPHHSLAAHALVSRADRGRRPAHRTPSPCACALARERTARWLRQAKLGVEKQNMSQMGCAGWRVLGSPGRWPTGPLRLSLLPFPKLAQLFSLLHMRLLLRRLSIGARNTISQWAAKFRAQVRCVFF